MSRKQFNVASKYDGLKQAVQALLEDSDDDGEYDLAIIPPDTAVVIDEEEDMETHSLPRDVPGTSSTVRMLFQMILTAVMTNHWPKNEWARQQQHERFPIWRKCSPTYSFNTQDTFAVKDRQNAVREKLKDFNPVQLFEKMFEEEVIQLILDNSILYATQNNRHAFQIDSSDLKKFTGILILSGYHIWSQESLYSSLDEDVGVELVKSVLTLNSTV